MSRFNTSGAVRPDTTNFAGAEAYKQDAKSELAALLLTSFVQNSYYRGADASIARAAELIRQVDPVFAAKAAVFARNEFGMRSISHVAAGEIAETAKGEQWTKDFFNKIVRRPDDMTEILSYILNKQTDGKSTIPNAVKKGFANAFTRFDDYSLAKYRGEGKKVNLVDAVRLVHPKSTSSIEKLVKGELVSTDTWETKLTQAGQKAETAEEKAALKDESWKEIIGSGKIGYMALIRNLRNILEQSPESVDKVLELLVDEERIRKSLVFPFTIQTAYMMIAGSTSHWSGRRTGGVNSPRASEVLTALSRAADISLGNLPKLGGKTLVAIDTSGSMQGTTSDRGVVRHVDIGTLMGAALAKSEGGDIALFASTTKIMPVNTDAPVLTIAEALASKIGIVGHGTNVHSVFQTATKAYDRIMIFSDMQTWAGGGTADGIRNEFAKRTGTMPAVYSFDLAGLGTSMFKPTKEYQVAGFSEKIFSVMGDLEADPKALIHRIEKTEL